MTDQREFLQLLFSMLKRLRLGVLCIFLPVAAVLAGPAEDVAGQLSILSVANPVSTAVGIELGDNVLAVDPSSVNSEALSPGASASLDPSDDLLAMDQPILAAENDVAAGPEEIAIVAAEGDVEPSAVEPLPSDKDQPALVPVVNIDPVFVAGRIQPDGGQCRDADGDGICDQDDQCLKTPKDIKVLANGCYIDGPQPQPLEGVFFAHDSSMLSSDAKAILNAAVAVIQQSDAQRIEVGGHTDSKGGERYNLRLSEARAKAVRAYLISQGVSAERLVAKGYGESDPRANNNLEAGRQQNRRVELKRLSVLDAN